MCPVNGSIYQRKNVATSCICRKKDIYRKKGDPAKGAYSKYLNECSLFSEGATK